MFIKLTHLLLQLLFILAFAPFLTGIIKKIKSKSQHRKGCSVFQVYYDIAKLFDKEVVKSNVTSVITDIAPYVAFITAVTAAMCVPMLSGYSLLGAFGDAVFIIYVLVLGRVFMALAALDAGSTFGGMGSSREMFIASLVEPAFVMMLFTLGVGSGHTSLNLMGAGGHVLVNTFLIVALFIVLMAETSRIPVDDPATHLELTMVHEAMILEYSGRQLALIHWANTVKQFFFIAFIANILLPTADLGVSGIGGLLLSLGILAVKSVLITMVIAFIEVKSVKTRFFSIPNLTSVAFVFAFMGFLISFIYRG